MSFRNKTIKTRPSAKLDELIKPTVLLYDGTEQAQKSAYIARSLADEGELHQLKILTLNHECEALAKQQLSFDKVKTEYQHIDSYDISNIVSLIGGQKTGLLILPLEDELINQSKEIKKTLDVLECPLLLVR